MTLVLWPTSVLCVSSGVIRTAVSNMDRETRDHYMLLVQAKDMAGSVGGLSGSTTINITLTDVNDNPPKFPQSEFCSVSVYDYLKGPLIIDRSQCIANNIDSQYRYCIYC